MEQAMESETVTLVYRQSSGIVHI